MISFNETLIPMRGHLELDLSSVGEGLWPSIQRVRVAFHNDEGDQVSLAEYEPARIIRCSAGELIPGSYDVRVSIDGLDWRFVTPILIGAPDLDERLQLFGEALQARGEAESSKGNEKKRHLQKAHELYALLGISNLAEEVKKELVPFDISLTPRSRTFAGKGTRKAATVRAWLRPGAGLIQVRTKDGYRPFAEYFTSASQIHQIWQPLRAVELQEQVDVHLNCSGGGKSGQAGAARRAIAVALTDWNPQYRKVLKDLGLLSSDARKHERKKYGLKGARKKSQFSKR